MPQTIVNLTEQNSRRLEDIAARTGMDSDQLMNQAVELLAGQNRVEESRRFQEWREAMLGAAGIWAERQDLPDFGDIRRSMDRDFSTR